jgi:hypothetical protein
MKNFNDFFLNESLVEELKEVERQLKEIDAQRELIDKRRLEIIQKINDEESISIGGSKELDPYEEEDWGNRKRFYIVKTVDADWTYVTFYLTVPSNEGWPKKFYLVDKELKITGNYITNDNTGNIDHISQSDESAIKRGLTKMHLSKGLITLNDIREHENEIGFYQPKMEI